MGEVREGGRVGGWEGEDREGGWERLGRVG